MIIAHAKFFGKSRFGTSELADASQTKQIARLFERVPEARSFGVNLRKNRRTNEAVKMAKTITARLDGGSSLKGC